MMFLRCLFQPVTMTSLQTAPSGKYVETLNFCQSFIYTLQQNMKGLRWLGLVWHSVLCFPRMARLQSDAPVSVSLVYFLKSLTIPVSPGSEVFTTQPWCTSMASLSQTTQEVTSHLRQMSQRFSDTQKSIIFKRSYYQKIIKHFQEPTDSCSE